jgi:cytoskeletal protein CcmA (bactofilin family)
VTGDVTASRLIIEDGAFFKGNIDIVKQVAEPETKADATIDAVQAPWVRKASQSEAANLRMQPIPMSA